MKRHDFVLLVIQGVLHRCPVDERGLPRMEYGSLSWEAVRASHPPEFLEEAEELILEDYELLD